MITPVGTPKPRALTTLNTVRDEYPSLAGRTDSSVNRLIASASDAIARYCGRQFQREAVRQAEGLPLHGPFILLRRPILATVPVVLSLDGAEQDAAAFVVDGAGILTRAGLCPAPWYGAGLVALYTGGWVLPSFPEADRQAATAADLLPSSIEEACLLTISAWSSARGRDPNLRSDTVEGVGGSSWVASTDMEGMPPQAVSLLAPFVTARGG